jgi:hypothetical protein
VVATRRRRLALVLHACLFAGVLACPFAGAALELVGTNEARLMWQPASGPVAAYGVWISRDGSPFGAQPELSVTAPEFTLTGLYGARYVILVAAFDAAGNQGPVSLPSDVIVFVREPAPGGEEPPPVAEEEPPPLVEDPPPIGEETPPAAEEPVVEQEAPPVVEEEAPPVVEEPVVGEAPPADEEAPPVVEEPPPLVVEPPPVAGEEAPPVVEEAPPPISEELPPAAEEPVIDAEEEAPPVTEEEAPPVVDEPPLATEETPPVVEEPPSARTLAPSWDFDGDGRRDLVWLDRSSREIHVWLMNGAGPREKAVLGSAGVATLLLSSDVDGDGRSDLVLGNPSSKEWWVWLIAGTRVTGMARVELSPNSAEYWTISAAGDLDGDGRGDLVSRRPAVNGVSVAGPPTLTASGALAFPTRAVGTLPAPLDLPGGDAVPGDFDGDGLVDLAWQDGSTRSLLLWLSQPDGSARAISLGAPESGLMLLAAEDFDGDGHDDLLLGNANAQDYRLWLLDGSLRPAEARLARTSPSEGFWKVLTCGDVDGDGRSDLVLRAGTTGRNEIGRVGAQLGAGTLALDIQVIDPLVGSSWEMPPR